MGIPVPLGFDPTIHDRIPVIDEVLALRIIEQEFDPLIHKCPVTQNDTAQSIVEREFDPEIHKAPVTKEYMALALAGKVGFEEEAEKHFSDALYESVAGMIYSLARKYSPTCGRDDIADLANSCVLRIYQNIHKYDPERGKFNTWAWWVCSSVLNRRYQKNLTHRERYSEWTDACDNYGESDTVAEISNDVEEALRELFALYPERVDILTEMFCREAGKFFVPDRISMRKVAETVGRDYSDVYSFVRNKVRPFIKSKFGGDNDGWNSGSICV